MKRGSWINAFAANENSAQGLAPQAREEISRRDDALYALEPWRQCRDRLDLQGPGVTLAFGPPFPKPFTPQTGSFFVRP